VGGDRGGVTRRRGDVSINAREKKPREREVAEPPSKVSKMINLSGKMGNTLAGKERGPRIGLFVKRRMRWERVIELSGPLVTI